MPLLIQLEMASLFVLRMKQRGLKSHAQFGAKLSGNRCIRIFGRADVLKCVPTVSTVEFRKGELFATCGTRLAISHEIAAHDHQRESD